MDDKKIEDLLRNSWSPQPPEGMRDRVLRQARLQTVKTPKVTILKISRWKLVLVSLAVAIIALCNISDHARSVRITRMTGGYSNNTPFQGGMNYLEMRREMDNILASVPYESIPKNTINGDESL